ncbi:MAG: DNA-binding response OmpR family regulator [Hyphomicrobiaceae bacterium]|jgi:DNA-binding response OmpR family regulator
MGEKIRVLLVEDDADVRRGMTLWLSRDFAVTAAEDSISGLVAARRDLPHVIVLDLGLPGGDGLQFLERLLEVPTLAQTPTIVVTGRDGAAVEQNAKIRGAHRVFYKPADPQELTDAVKELGISSPPTPRRLLVVEDDVDLRQDAFRGLHRDDGW